MRPPVDAATLRAFLHYDPATGEFTWIAKPGPKINVGSRAGKTDKQGYRRIHFLYRTYAAHRLAWLYVYGDWPRQLIDHIDRNPGNNRIANLRDVSHSVNCRNRSPRAFLPRDGIRGVTFHKQTGKWQATLCLPKRKQQHLGLHPTQEAAAAAYQAARQAYGDAI